MLSVYDTGDDKQEDLKETITSYFFEKEALGNVDVDGDLDARLDKKADMVCESKQGEKDTCEIDSDFEKEAVNQLIEEDFSVKDFADVYKHLYVEDISEEDEGSSQLFSCKLDKSGDGDKDLKVTCDMQTRSGGTRRRARSPAPRSGESPARVNVLPSSQQQSSADQLLEEGVVKKINSIYEELDTISQTIHDEGGIDSECVKLYGCLMENMEHFKGSGSKLKDIILKSLKSCKGEIPYSPSKNCKSLASILNKLIDAIENYEKLEKKKNKWFSIPTKFGSIKVPDVSVYNSLKVCFIIFVLCLASFILNPIYNRSQESTALTKAESFASEFISVLNMEYSIQRNELGMKQELGLEQGTNIKEQMDENPKTYTERLFETYMTGEKPPEFVYNTKEHFHRLYLKNTDLLRGQYNRKAVDEELLKLFESKVNERGKDFLIDVTAKLKERTKALLEMHESGETRGREKIFYDLETFQQSITYTLNSALGGLNEKIKLSIGNTNTDRLNNLNINPLKLPSSEQQLSIGNDVSIPPTNTVTIFDPTSNYKKELDTTFDPVANVIVFKSQSNESMQTLRNIQDFISSLTTIDIPQKLGQTIDQFHDIYKLMEYKDMINLDIDFLIQLLVFPNLNIDSNQTGNLISAIISKIQRVEKKYQKLNDIIAKRDQLIEDLQTEMHYTNCPIPELEIPFSIPLTSMWLLNQKIPNPICVLSRWRYNPNLRDLDHYKKFFENNGRLLGMIEEGTSTPMITRGDTIAKYNIWPSTQRLLDGEFSCSA